MACNLRFNDRQVGHQAPFEFELYNGDNPIDLTAGGTTTVRMVNALTGVEIFNKNATSVTALGVASYIPLLSEVAVAGDYKLQAKHVDGSGFEYVSAEVLQRILPNP